LDEPGTQRACQQEIFGHFLISGEPTGRPRRGGSVSGEGGALEDRPPEVGLRVYLAAKDIPGFRPVDEVENVSGNGQGPVPALVSDTVEASREGGAVVP
jgi:hypothetical protein